MATDTDERDDLNDDEDEDLLDDDLDLKDDAEDDESDESESSEKEKKRLRDLQSKADKETARANKAEAALAALKAGGVKPGEGKPTGSVDPEVQKWLSVAKESARTRLYESDPRFKEYGLPPSLISGDSPEDMETSFTQLKRLVGKVESRVRDSVLKEHGFAEAPRSGTATPKRDFTTMSKEDFEKVVNAALHG